MSKVTNNLVLDAALDFVANNGVYITVCSTPQPDTWTKAKKTSETMLVEHALTSGDYAIANSTSTGGGRTVTIAAQSSLSVSAAGDAKYVCILSSSGDDDLLIVTECSTPIQSLTTGNTVNIPNWKITIEDPA